MIVFHIPLKNFSAFEYISIIDRIKGKCTHLIIGELANCVEWETMLDFLPGSLYNDGRQYSGAMDKIEFGLILGACRTAGIEVIPDFRFFSHQRKSFLNLQQNGKAKVYAINDRTSAVSDEVLLMQSLLMKEVCEMIKPKIAYIGHDECFIEGTPLLKTEKLTGRPATLKEFKVSVLALHKDLSKLGVIMAMSADAFIERGQFKGVVGGSNGSAATVRMLKEVPKDVVMVTWNYRGITREVIEYFTDLGHDTIGLMFDTVETYPQLKTAIEGNEKAHAGLSTWSRLRAGKDGFIEEFNKQFPIIEPQKKLSLWDRIKQIFS